MRMRRGYHLIVAHAQRLSSHWCACPKVTSLLVRICKGNHLIGAHAQRLPSYWCARTRASSYWCACKRALSYWCACAKGFHLIGALAGRWNAFRNVASLLYCLSGWVILLDENIHFEATAKIPLFEKVEKLALNIYFCTYIFAFENHQNTLNDINHCPLNPIFYIYFVMIQPTV